MGQPVRAWLSVTMVTALSASPAVLRSVSRCAGPSESSPDCSDSCERLPTDLWAPGNQQVRPGPWLWACQTAPSQPLAPVAMVTFQLIASVDQQVKRCKVQTRTEAMKMMGGGCEAPVGAGRVLAAHLPQASPERHLWAQQVALWLRTSPD